MIIYLARKAFSLAPCNAALGIVKNNGPSRVHTECFVYHSRGRFVFGDSHVDINLNVLRQTRVPLCRGCRLELSVFILHFYASSNEDVTSSVTLGRNEAGALPMGQKIEPGMGFWHSFGGQFGWRRISTSSER